LKKEKMMNEPKILVTGAPGGTQGSTAGKLVQLLLDAHVPVRAFVHSTGPRTEALARLGAEIHVGDMLDIVSMRAAMKGIEKVFFCYPVQPGLLDAAAVIAQVGKEEHIQFLVNLSQGSATSDSISPRARQHWLSEQLFNWSGIPVFHLRGGVFIENIYRQWAKGLVEQGQLRAPFGDGKGEITLITGDDIARAAFAALLNPDAFIGKTLLIVSESLSLIEIARQTGEVLGYPISYQEISSEDWLKEAKSREGSENSEQHGHLVKLWQIMIDRNQAGAAVKHAKSAPNLLELTGYPGQTLKGWLASDAFKQTLNADRKDTIDWGKRASYQS
jgi:uncharacterized protein YbjT (DUF2867 family)